MTTRKKSISNCNGKEKVTMMTSVAATADADAAIGDGDAKAAFVT